MKVPPPLKLASSPSAVDQRIPSSYSQFTSSPGGAGHTTVPTGTDAFWRSYPMLIPPHTPNTPGLPSWNVLMEIRNQMPQHLALDPRFWSREDVTSFLQWFQKEFDVPEIDTEKFSMNGKALSLLTKQDVSTRAPGAGDILHNALQVLLHLNPFRMPLSPFSLMSPPNSAAPWSQGQGQAAPPIEQATPTSQQSQIGYHFLSSTGGNHVNSSSVTLSPAPSTDSQSSSPKHSGYVNGNGSTQSGEGRRESDSDENNREDSSSPKTATGAWPPASNEVKTNGWKEVKQENPTPTPNKFSSSENGQESPGSGGRLLWDFLQQLLNDSEQKYTSFISWKNRDTGVFKINDPAGLAHLWGIQKNHLSMNYDKMSRALRYYYRVNILRKVQGERHCYQFLRNPSELRGIKNISLLRNSSPPTRGADMKPTIEGLNTSSSSPALPTLLKDRDEGVMNVDESSYSSFHRPTPTNTPTSSTFPKHEQMDDTSSTYQFKMDGGDENNHQIEEPTDLSLPSSLRKREASMSPSPWKNNSSPLWKDVVTNSAPSSPFSSS